MSSGLFKNVIYKLHLQIKYNMYKEVLAYSWYTLFITTEGIYY